MNNTNTQNQQMMKEISNDTVKQFEQIKTSMDFLHQIGIKFVIENVNIPPQNNTNLLNNPIAKKDANTIISITEIENAEARVCKLTLKSMPVSVKIITYLSMYLIL